LCELTSVFGVIPAASIAALIDGDEAFMSASAAAMSSGEAVLADSFVWEDCSLLSSIMSEA
jgi:hypothetical protein